MSKTGCTAGNGRRCGVLLAICFLFTAGCAAYPRLKLKEISAAETPRILSAVPFFPQTENQCGPAALAGVLGAAGVSISPETLSPQVYLPSREGSLQIELVAATRRAGLIPYVLSKEPRALLDEIEAGRPVLILQNLLTRIFPVWHYAVLIGIDPDANRLYLNSGTRQGLKMGARKFLRTWNWAGRWAMVALQPGSLPAMGDPMQYAEAVAAFEVVAGFKAALPAWEAAVRQWPRDSRAHLALGNSAYNQGDLTSAVRHYLQGLTLNESDPGLNNNLASVFGELGCPRAGERYLHTAEAGLASDSVWKPVIEATLSELALQPGNDPESCAEFEK